MKLYNSFGREVEVDTKASISNLSSPQSWLLDAVGGRKTIAGKSLGATEALMDSAVWACVRNLAQDVAKVPFSLKLRRGDGGSDRVTNHPVAELLEEPNDWQSSYDFALFRGVQLALYGNFYAFIERDVNGVPIQIIPIRSERVTVHEATDGSGDILYHISVGNEFERGNLQPLFDRFGFYAPASVIHHVRDISRDSIVGMSPVSYGAESIGLSLAAEEHSARTFANGTRLSGILTSSEKLNPQQAAEFRKAWHENYAGNANAMRTAIMWGGLKFEPMSMTNEDAELIPARKFQISEIARRFRMPPHKIYDLDRSTNNNIEHQSLEYLTDTIMPILVNVAKRCRKDLLTRQEKLSGLFFDFDESALIRGDMRAMAESTKAALGGAGWMTPNEGRMRIGLNPVQGGDEIWRPLNMEAVDATGGDDAGRPDTPGDLDG